MVTFFSQQLIYDQGSKAWTFGTIKFFREWVSYWHKQIRTQSYLRTFVHCNISSTDTLEAAGTKPMTLSWDHSRPNRLSPTSHRVAIKKKMLPRNFESRAVRRRSRRNVSVGVDRDHPDGVVVAGATKSDVGSNVVVFLRVAAAASVVNVENVWLAVGCVRSTCRRWIGRNILEISLNLSFFDRVSLRWSRKKELKALLIYVQTKWSSQSFL